MNNRTDPYEVIHELMFFSKFNKLQSTALQANDMKKVKTMHTTRDSNMISQTHLSIPFYKFHKKQSDRFVEFSCTWK